MTRTDQSTTATAVEQPTGRLRADSLGTGAIAFIVISAAAPLTVIAGVGPLAVLIGGIGAPVAYIAAGLVLAIFSVAFMAMTKHIKAMGGFYTYVTAALGKVVGLGASTLAWFSYNAMQIGLFGLLGVQANGFFQASFAVDIPWWVFAAVGIVGVHFIASRGIDVGAKVLIVLLTAETAILLVFAIAVLAQGGAEGITFGSFAPDAIAQPGMLAILGFAFAAFMGFESTALYRAEARNPDRTIPRATFIAVAFMALFYGFIVWAIVLAAGESGAQGAAAADLPNLVFNLAGQYLGPWAQIAMYVLFVTSVFAALLAFHNAINRYTFSLARDGAFPGALSRTNPKTGAPTAAGLVQTVLAVVVVGLFALAGADPYLQLLLWVNSPGVLGILALQALTSVAVIVFFIRRRDVPRAWYVLPAAVVASAALFALLISLIIALDTLTLGGPVVNAVILVSAALSLVIGIVLALVWRRTRPQVYAKIGGSGAE